METKRDKTILALVAGLALGVGLGMLLAPEKGSKIRKKIKKKVMSSLDSMQGDKEGQGFTDAIFEKVDTVEEKIDEVVTHMVNEGLDATEALIAKLEKKLNSLRNKTADSTKTKSES